MPDRTVAGKSIVTRRAVVDIIRIAVQGSYGVMGFSDPSLGRRILRLVGLDRPGIRLTTEGGLAVDLYIDVASGVPIAEVARQVDSAVRYSIRQHLGVELASLAIHVDGLRYQPTPLPASEPAASEHAADGHAKAEGEPIKSGSRPRRRRKAQ